MPQLKVDWMQIICTRKVFETWTCKAYLGIWGKKQVIFYKKEEVPRRRGFVTTGLTEGGVWMFARVCQMIVDAPGGWHTVAHGGTHCGTECGTLCASHISRGDPPPEQSPRLTMYSLLSSYIATCMHHIYVPAPDISQEPTKYLQHLWSQSYGKKCILKNPPGMAFCFIWIEIDSSHKRLSYAWKKYTIDLFCRHRRVLWSLSPSP